MLDRSQFLVVHGAYPKAWADRYGIEPFTQPCYNCDAPMTTSIPFACGAFRGLVAPECRCGEDFPPYCAVLAPGQGDLLLGSVT
jgi:hypothetical protein